MAWGGRGLMSRNYRLSLRKETAEKLVSVLTTLRVADKALKEDFNIIQQAAEEIKGLGISFYTKLLFFLRRDEDAYILDQFTAKSAQLLFNPPPVRLTSQGYPLSDKRPEEYEDFCRRVEELSSNLQQMNVGWTPEKVEQAMFDIRGGSWRKYLRSHFPPKAALRKSNMTTQKIGSTTTGVKGHRDIDKKMMTLANKIVELHHTYLENDDIELPIMDGDITSTLSLRIHCFSIDGITWQYSIQQKSVHAQVFIPNKHIGRYDMLCKALDVHNHDFGSGIMGSGSNKDGRTRSIKLTLTFSTSLDDTNIDEYARKSVQNMSTLHKEIGEYI
jgi:hypothetical protein